MTFGEKLKHLRTQANLTQQQVANRINITRQAIAKWEQGVGLPDIDNLKKISSLFNVSIDEMLDYKIEDINVTLNETIEECNEKGFKRISEFILEKFANANEIYQLSQEINLKLWQEIVYSLLDFDVVLGLHDFIQNGIVYAFYIKTETDNYLALVKKSTLMTKKLDNDFVKRHLVVDGYRYEKIKKLK